MQVKFDKVDRGHERTYYKSRSGLRYCTQPDYKNKLTWYFCTKDGEPSHEVEGIEFITVEKW